MREAAVHAFDVNGVSWSRAAASVTAALMHSQLFVGLTRPPASERSFTLHSPVSGTLNSGPKYDISWYHILVSSDWRSRHICRNDPDADIPLAASPSQLLPFIHVRSYRRQPVHLQGAVHLSVLLPLPKAVTGRGILAVCSPLPGAPTTCRGGASTAPSAHRKRDDSANAAFRRATADSWALFAPRKTLAMITDGLR